MTDNTNTAISLQVQDHQDRANPPPLDLTSYQPPIVLSLFDLTGNFLQPWHEAGYECWCVDIQHTPGETNVTEGDCSKDDFVFVGADLRKWIPPRNIIDRVCFVASFSPCDHAAVSGARWFKDEHRGKGLRGLAESIELFAIGRDWIKWFGVPGFCEHPVSTISTYYREADHSFHPYQFTGLCPDENYMKNTQIWEYNGFRMPETELASPLIEDAIKWAKVNKPKNVTVQQFLRYLDIPEWVKRWHPDDRIHKAAPDDDRRNFRSATPMGFAYASQRANAPLANKHYLRGRRPAESTTG